MHVNFMSTESEWLKWWNEVGIFQLASTTNRDQQVASKWNWSFSVTTDDQQTQSTGTTVKWNMLITDTIRGQQLQSFVF